MAAFLLEMRNITKKFPGVTALRDVSIHANAGEILAIVGENGAGKSTLMKILSGAYPADTYEGIILVDGRDVSFRSPQDSENIGIAMIYQEIHTHLDLSVAENVFLGNWPKKAGRVQWDLMNSEASKYLSMAGLEVNPRQTVRELNTSQQQLLSIAAALARQPRILVLDEPTSALTEKESVRLFEILHRLKSEGIASLLISHKLDEVFANADRITVLRDGQMISDTGIGKADRDRIIADMVGREITDLFPKEEVPIGDIFLEVKGFTVPHPFNPHKDIIQDAAFSVRKGEILGIAGLVGAGRSELVNAIFGKDSHKAGEVYLDGEKLSIRNPGDAIRNGLALVTEDRKVDGFVSVLDVKSNTTLASLKAVSRRGRLLRKRERTEAGRWFDKLKVKANNLETILATLSGGNQQKVVLAKWLMTNPRLLILDEPTRGIDVGAKQEIYRIMTDLVKQGISIIMISSELPELISMSDRVVILSGGRITGELDRHDLSPEQIMHYATIGNFEELEEKAHV